MQSFLEISRRPVRLMTEELPDGIWAAWLGDVVEYDVEGNSELDAQEKLISLLKEEGFEVVEMFSQDNGKTFVNEVVR